MKDFLDLFKFDPSRTLCVGVERERFITDNTGSPVPYSKEVLNLLPKDGSFGYELSACQLEDRVGPIPVSQLSDGLRRNDQLIEEALDQLGLDQAFYEVASNDMDLTVFNDPTGRYQKIVKNMPKEILQAACQVAGTHTHIGMPNMETALSVYNSVIDSCRDLCSIIDNSSGVRLLIYKKMAPDYAPRHYATVQEFYEDAVHKGFVTDPRKNWQLIRITVHGTIEFRMGGATSSYEQIKSFVQQCHHLCSSALMLT